MVPLKIEQLGLAASLMLSSRRYLTLHIASLQISLMPAITVGQILFIFSSNGEPICYFTWGLLSERTIQAIRGDPNYILHASEWNEGNELWIMDIVIAGGRAREIFKLLKLVVFRDHVTCSWLRRRKDGSVKFSRFIRMSKPEWSPTFPERLHLTSSDVAPSYRDWYARAQEFCET